MIDERPIIIFNDRTAGVYAIDALSVVEGLPRHLRKYSKPTRPYGTDLEG